MHRHDELPRAGGASPWSARRTLGCLAAAGLLAAGCGRAVTVAEPSRPAIGPTALAACATLADQLPDRLAGEPRLALADDTGTAAAWGTPAIVWRCGVAKPAALAPTSQLVKVNGVDWFPEQLTEGVRFTSVAASPAIELTVPEDYPAGAALLARIPKPATTRPS